VGNLCEGGQSDGTYDDARGDQKQMTKPQENVACLPRLLSVGHSHHDLDAFVALLRGAGVTAVADVRSSPFSRRLPHFNGPQLAATLRARGVTYVFLGDLLGGRPEPDELYDADGRVDYERVRATDFFREGLDRLLQVAEQFTVAMLCSEEDPLDCHRGLMIAPALAERGVHVGHLRGDGRIESTEVLEQRLLVGSAGAALLEGLFAPLLTSEERRQTLAEAYRRMARRKAYRRSAEELEDC
jgi:hypothetical protein